MDPFIGTGLGMLVLWGVFTFTTEAPGAIHLLLTAGVFILIWRIVVRDTPSGPGSNTSGDARKR